MNPLLRAWLTLVGLIAVFVAVVAMMCCVGCTTIDIVKPDGTQIRAASLFSDKGIQSAKLEGFGSIDGYTSNVNADAIRAVAEGVAAGLTKAAVKP